MNCDETTALLSEQLNGVLAAEDQRRLESHLATCAACRDEAAAVGELWNDMGIEEIAVPHERMRARFHAALAAYDERPHSAIADRIVQYIWPRRPLLQLATAVLLIVAGVFVGRNLPDPIDNEISGLRDDLRIVSIALLEHQSATERLRGVEWLQERVPPSSAVTDALLQVVRNDQSVNVRLAAVEALSGELGRPDVGQALADALTREQTPLMQVTLAETLLRNNVAGSVATVQQVIDRDDVDMSVQDYLRAVIARMEEDRQNGQLL
jgi:predicted anti-sigma-YlaC factor YlaD